MTLQIYTLIRKYTLYIFILLVIIHLLVFVFNHAKFIFMLHLRNKA